ncbi:MAG: hypothetical protein ACKPEA_18520, partial [Planctomycetota bacterium]
MAGFVLFDIAGTAGAYRVIALVLLTAGIAAAGLSPAPRRWAYGAGAMAAAVALVVASPSNLRLWEFLSGDDGGN